MSGKKLNSTITSKALIRENFSDAGNGRRLVGLYGDFIRYCSMFKSWYVWNGKRWEPDTQNKMGFISKKTIERLFTAAYQSKMKIRAKVLDPKAFNEHDRADKLIRFALLSESAQHIRSMIELATSEPKVSVKPSDLDTNPWLLNVDNGTIDLKMGTLLPHDRKYLITKISPVAFDSKADCPRFKKFLVEVLMDNEVIRYVQKALGYALTGIVREHCLFLFWGLGRNGKGTILERVMPKILGEYLHTATLDLLLQKRTDGHSTAFADLHGTRLVVCGETKSGARFNEAMVKAITGGDRITARKLYKDNFTFEPTHKVFMHTNHKPQVYGREIALWDRLKIIKFPRSFTEIEIDHKLEPTLFKELPGILNWLVEGCLAWQKEGLLTPEKIRMEVEDYKTETDLFGNFLRETFDGKPIDMPFSTLYLQYIGWTQENGEKKYGRNFVSGLLRERGFEIYPGTGNKSMVRGGVNQLTTVNQKTETSL